MNLLTAAVPGLREIRGPLVAGYLWLVAAWLLIEPNLPLVQSATGPVQSLVELAGLVGSVGTAAAVSVIAYLVGSFWHTFAEMTHRPKAFFAGGPVGSYSWYLRSDDRHVRADRMTRKEAEREAGWRIASSEELAEAVETDSRVADQVRRWVLDPLPGDLIPASATEQLADCGRISPLLSGRR